MLNVFTLANGRLFQEEIDHADAWDLDSQLEQAMDALRCPPPDADVTTLSGGERRRVALCKLLLQKPDLLLLDEPTNHLDIVTKRALTKALRAYEGTLVFVSHDRAFLRALATRVLELSAAPGATPHIYGGTYGEYVATTGREAPGMRAN